MEWRENEQYRLVSERADNAVRKYGDDESLADSTAPPGCARASIASGYASMTISPSVPTPMPTASTVKAASSCRCMVTNSPRSMPSSTCR